MTNNISDWHRKQRRKEVQKNKAARILNRDEKVLSSKSIQSIAEEIKTIEKQHKDPATRPHGVKSKLDRLQKELKIVKEAERKQLVPKPVTSRAPAFQPLANPAVSVYYDPVMNPYGEPPPGKSRLYHRLGGGTTFNIKEAGLPGESLSSAPPPAPHRHLPPSKAPSNLSREAARVPSTGRKESFHNPSIKSVQGGSNEGRAVPHDSGAARRAADPGGPSLPEPSPSVKRMRHKLSVDIWASNEEIEYEQAQEDEASRGGPEWYYCDQSGQSQGPYPTASMVSWVKAGYFSASSLVRVAEEFPWKMMETFEEFRHISGKSERHSALHSDREVSSKRASTVQDRIAGLRKQSLEQPATDSELPATEVKQLSPRDGDSVQDRIAALREELVQGQSEEVTGSDLRDEPTPGQGVAAGTTDDVIYDVGYNVEYEIGDESYLKSSTVTGTYPMEQEVGPTSYDQVPEHGEMSTFRQPPKKKVKVDKDVVALLPSNVRNRKST